MTQPNSAAWLRSTRCEATACVEARREGNDVQLRNSTEPGLVLAFDTVAWGEFRAGVMHGEFDRLP